MYGMMESYIKNLINYMGYVILVCNLLYVNTTGSTEEIDNLSVIIYYEKIISEKINDKLVRTI